MLSDDRTKITGIDFMTEVIATSRAAAHVQSGAQSGWPDSPIPPTSRFTQVLCRKPPPSTLGLNRRRCLFPCPGLCDQERKPDQPRHHRRAQEPRVISREAAIILLQAKRHE